MEEWGKRKIVLRRAPPAFAPPPPSNPAPFPPPRALKTKSGAAKRALSRAFGALFLDLPAYAEPLILLASNDEIDSNRATKETTTS